MGVVGLVGLFIIGMVSHDRGNVNKFLKPRAPVEGGVMRRDGGWRFPTRGGGWVKKIFSPQIDNAPAI